MLRRVFKILLCMIVALNVTVAPAAVAEPTTMSPVVNVKYIHDAILAKWNVSVGYNSALTNKSVAANMKYLLAAIDVANKKIGGSSKVYSGTSYATSYAVNKQTADNAIKNLIKKPRTFPFTATTSSDTTSFSFKISAAGEFWVDWGDGSDIQVITKADTDTQNIRHTYATAAAYNVRLGGLATAYPMSTTKAAISFESTSYLTGISGSLGAIFPTLANGGQPSFYRAFYGGLKGSIPENLFAGIHGAPVRYMFNETFAWCSGLTGSIPENLFAGIKGAPADNMFSGTFRGCRGLTGSIPEKLFAGIAGAPAWEMFNYTFSGCSGLTGSIPEKLFAGIAGAPATSMFNYTFSDCSGLTGSIPEKLFAGIAGAPAREMFSYTFNGCSGLTGSIPSRLFGELSGAPAYSMFEDTFNGCSGLTGEIPSGLFGELSGAPAYHMFHGTFERCSGLTGEIPLGLFGNLSGALVSGMFNYAFYNCKGLTGKSARNPDGTYLYDVFPSATSSQFGGMYTGTCLYDNASIPSEWGGKACTYTGPIPPDEVTDFPFSVTTVPNTSSMDIMLNAWGNFTIDWGDGNREAISRTTANTKEQIFSHTYASAGTYEIKFAGTPTGYPSELASASSGERHFDPTAIQFRNPYSAASKCNIASVSGKLGALFPTLTSALTGSGVQPVFDSTFSECAQLTEIPAGLFDGITGTPVSSMFKETFSETGITEIPAGLFDGISGEPMEYIFSATFAGTPIKSIPAGLFDGINGNAEEMAFAYAFAECTNLTSIPQGLFDGMTVDAKTGYDAFAGTFYGCTALTGPSAQMSDGTYLYELDGFDDGVGNSMYLNDTGLDDYSTMPNYLKE